MLRPLEQRTYSDNLLLAVSLSAVAGAVNMVGLKVLGVFSSHVTGNASRAGEAAALAQGSAALHHASLVVAFFAGALCAGIIVEGARRLGQARFALALVVEAAVLSGVAWLLRGQSQSTADVATRILCFSMGLQNALVTNVSGAVVRTTHLTGVVTDLGLEVARWMVSRTHRISLPRLLLLSSIVAGFLVGTAWGTLMYAGHGVDALWGPVFALLGLTLLDAVRFYKGALRRRAQRRAARNQNVPPV